MKVILSNNNNKIAKVNFSRIAKVASVRLHDLRDVSTAGQKDGDVLVFHTNTNSYYIETLPDIDGGIY